MESTFEPKENLKTSIEVKILLVSFAFKVTRIHGIQSVNKRLNEPPLADTDWNVLEWCVEISCACESLYLMLIELI